MELTKKDFSCLRFDRSLTGNIGLLLISILFATGYLGPLILELDPYSIGSEFLQKPQWFSSSADGHFFGTDDLGRDHLSRLVYGARNSLSIGLGITLIAALMGTFLGLIAGVYGGWLNVLIMRLADVILCLPTILLAIVIVSVLGPGLVNAMVAVTVVSIPKFARLIRSVSALEMQKGYVLAASASGTSKFKILWAEVLPNCWAPIIVQSVLGFSEAILEVAALGFLGLGAKPPAAEWGAMLASARPFIESEPYLVVLPGLCILITVLGLNLVGDALRDALDPRTRNNQ